MQNVVINTSNQNTENTTKRQLELEAWENTSSESQLVSVLHLIGWKSGGTNHTTK